MIGTENIKPKKSKKIPQKPEKRRPRKITAQYLHNAGLAYLQRFAASSHHFKVVMTRKIDKSCHAHPDQSRKASLALLDDLTTKFIDLGLLDDAAYLRGKVMTLRRKGHGTRMILMRLNEKGFQTPEILEVLKTIDAQAYPVGDGEIIAALHFIRRKRFGAFRTRTANDKTPQRELASLARGGYSYDIAHQVLNMSLDAAEAYLETNLETKYF